MINFEEELKKFQPSLELGELEENIYNLNLTDAADVLIGLIQESETTEGQY